MKKIIYSFGIIAASAFVFSACEKEQATQDEVRSEGKLVTISFTAEKAGLETKTAAVEGATDVSYIWTTEDIANIKLFTVEGGSLATEVDSPVITKVSDTKLTISATVAANATYTFRAILCDPSSYTSSGDDYTARKPRIKTSQTPNGTSNFDPTADILVSDDKEVTVGEETTTGDMLLSFRRQVVVNKMTLKNLVEGEKISKVVVKSDKNLTGYLENGSMTGQSKELALNYSDVAVPASGQFVVYFITMPNTEQTLTVEVTTDQNTYSKNFTKTIDFNLGEFTKFGVSLPAGTPITDLSGYYLIGCLNSNYWQLMDSEINTSGSNHYYPKYTSTVGTAAASVDFSEFSGIANIDKYLWKVEAYDGAYSIKSVDTGNYLSYTGSSNAAQAVAELAASAKFTITLSASTATIESCNVAGRVLKYNSGSPRFAFYASGQNDIFLIPATYDDRTPVTLSFADSTPSYDTDHYGDFTGQAVTASPNVAAITGNITWSIDDTADNITSSFNTATGALVLNGSTGSATVTASFAGDGTYRAAEASYTITVTTAGGGSPYTYTLTPANGSNNSYTGNCDIEIDGITWNLTGNSTMQPWRIGGKNLSSVDRELYSKTAIDADITKIVITHGTASNITVNSMTVTVSKNSDFSDPVSTLTPAFVASGDVTINRPDGKDWSDCYYKFTYNVTVSGNTNRYLQFTEAVFTGTK